MAFVGAAVALLRQLLTSAPAASARLGARSAVDRASMPSTSSSSCVFWGSGGGQASSIVTSEPQGVPLDPHGNRDVSSRRSCGSSVTMAVRDEDSGTSQRSTRNHGPSASSVTACAPSLSCYPPLACGCDASETPSSHAKAPTLSLDARDALIDNALDERGEARLTCQPSAVSTLSQPASPSSPPPAVSSVYGYGYGYDYDYGYGRAPSERAAAVSAPASSAPCALPAHSTCDIIITSSRSSAVVLDPSRGHGMQGLTASSALLYLSPRASTVGLPHACTWCLAASYPAARQHSA